MNKIKLLMYTVLSLISATIAWVLYFLADGVAKFSDAWDSGADHYHKKVIGRT